MNLAPTVVRTPHLARALFTGGHTRYYSEAFVRFIGDGGPAFVAGGAVSAVNDRHLTIKALDIAVKRRCPTAGSAPR